LSFILQLGGDLKACRGFTCGFGEPYVCTEQVKGAKTKAAVDQ